MALTADRNVEFYTSQELIDVPVDDNVKIEVQKASIASVTRSS